MSMNIASEPKRHILESINYLKLLIKREELVHYHLRFLLVLLKLQSCEYANLVTKFALVYL